MPATHDQFTNFGATTLAGGAGGAGSTLLATDTTMTVANTAKLPASAPATLVLTNGASQEIVKCTAIAGGVYTIARGQESTTALAFPVGAVVASEPTAGSFNNLWTRIQGASFNVADYGAVGDGVTDDTAAIQNALNDANANGGGVVALGPHTYLTGTLTLYSFVDLRGAGISATTLKLKTGANADLVWGGSANAALISIQAAWGAGSTGGLANWGLYDLTLDGNKAGQTAGPSYPLRVYGYGFIIQNVRIKNGYSGGLLTDWNGGAATPGNDSMEAEISNLKAHDCNSIGVILAGPHDSQLSRVMSYNNGSHGFYFPIHAEGILCNLCHAYNNGTGATYTSYLIEAVGCQLDTCVGEGNGGAQLVLLANTCTISNGDLFGFSAHPSSAVQIGQAAGLTPYDQSGLQSGGLTTALSVSGCSVDGISNGCQSTNGVVFFGNDGGHNLVRLVIYAASGTLATGFIATSTTLICNTSGIDSGRSGILTPGGQFCLTDNGSVATIGTGGTITTNSNCLSRVTTSAAVTGVILQAGNWQGQMCTVVNESGNSITFAANATSHVADGTSDVLGAFVARGFVWDSGAALWYRLA